MTLGSRRARVAGTLACIFACLLPQLSVAASSPAAAATIAPELPANAEVIARLSALKPNQAVSLGDARLVGEFNDVARRFNLHRSGPRARDYSIKMVWAQERKRALFAGANHGQPHRLNDVWEFDLGALAWAMLYAPDNPRSYSGLGEDASDVEYRDGVLVTRRGGPAVVGHTWWGLAYHPGIRRMLWMNVWSPKFDKLIEQVGGDPTTRYKGLQLWSFDPQTARWEVLRTSGPAPRVAFAGMLDYVDSLGEVLWHANNWQMRGTWLFEADKQRWRDLQANAAQGDFQSQAPAPEQVAYYDPGRDLLVVQRGRSTFHFDVKRNAWAKVRSEPADSADVPDGHDARTPFVFDPVSGHGLLVEYRSNTIWSYRPEDHVWTRLAPLGDPMPEGRKRLSYFDPEHGVLVVIDGVRVWAYRYR